VKGGGLFAYEDGDGMLRLCAPQANVCGLRLGRLQLRTRLLEI
jgi:hypothetical protein